MAKAPQNKRKSSKQDPGRSSHKLKPSDLPARPGPGPSQWSYNHWRVAQLKAAGKTYRQIHEQLSEESKSAPKLTTIQSYVKIPGFNELEEHFKDTALALKRDLWYREEADLILDGIRQAHATLTKLMSGQPVIEGGKAPSNSESMAAALEYMKVVGYAAAKEIVEVAKARAFADDKLSSGGGQSGGGGGSMIIDLTIDTGEPEHDQED